MMSGSHDVQPIPADYGSITPYLIVKGAAPLIDFLQQAFGAVERGRVCNDDGTIGHAEVWIGNAVVMLFDAQADWPATPSFLTLYVADCDATHHAALQAGATTVTELSTNAWGDRGSRIRDPFGNLWWLQTHVEDVADDEIAQRMHEARYIQDLQVSAATLDRAMKRIGAS